jgi:hypothetical protein
MEKGGSVWKYGFNFACFLEWIGSATRKDSEAFMAGLGLRRIANQLWCKT